MKSILFIDDERFNHRILDKYFESCADFHFYHAFSGKEALVFLETRSVDLIILDAIMPEMDGFEIAKKIRKQEKEFTPIIMLTALSDEKSRLAASEAKINDFLTKPIDFFALNLSIQNLLEMKRMFKEVNFFRDFYKSLIDSLTDNIFVLNPQGEILFSNFMAKRMLEKFHLEPRRFLETLNEKASRSFPLDQKMSECMNGVCSLWEDYVLLENFYFQVKIIPNLFENQVVLIFKDLSSFYQKASQLESDLSRREQDLRRAVYIQKNLMLKPIPKTKNLILKSLYVPSSSIGGDFHAVFRQKDQIAGLIADVSGHGIEAALYGTLLFMAAENHREILFEDTGAFLKVLDQEMSGLNLGHNFITALSFRYQIRSQEFHFSSAGHPAPLLKREGSQNAVSLDSDLGGPPLCAGLGDFYPEVSQSLKDGNFRILLYTDGLVEDFLHPESEAEKKQAALRLLDELDWFSRLGVLKKQFLAREEHPDVDDATVIFLEKRSPERLHLDLTAENIQDLFETRLVPMLSSFDYQEDEQNDLNLIFTELGRTVTALSKSGKVEIRMNAAWVLLRFSTEGPSQPVIFEIPRLSRQEAKKIPPEKREDLGFFLAACYSDKFMYQESGANFLSAFKKGARMTDYCSRYEESSKGDQ